MNTSNILATIADLEAGVKELDETKAQLEASIASLRQLLNNPWLINPEGASSTARIGQWNARAIHHLPKTPRKPDEIVPSDRVQAALNELNGRFSRSELFEKARKDGHGDIARGTFANIFSKLIKRNQIVCVEGVVGQRSAIYMKTKEYEESKASQPQEQPIFGLEGLLSS